ncbi:MAG: CDP-alcohol phosphatidyltransferase family protein [Thermodesulfobacteria bacterium]|nr:CDP-alcohol phosphatidyltransferase family protein [Thermodesulfobacteriota bacterium]
MNLPNLLTILRILLTPLLVIFLINKRFELAFAVFVVAGLSDGLDGLLARVMKQKTKIGAILDPIADKALLASAYITLAVIGLLPNWLAVTVISRDIIIVFGVLVLLLFHSGIEIHPTIISKLTTLFQLLTVFIVLFSTVTLIDLERMKFCCYVVTAILTVASGLDYLYKGILMLGNE